MLAYRVTQSIRLLVLGVLLCAAPSASASESASDLSNSATLLRIFLTDGTALVSYGEFARVDDRIVFSMPVGGTPEQPRLHMVSVPAGEIDWPRTERYGASARYQHYAATQGEEDFSRLSDRVARVLNDIALTTEPVRALQMAMQARSTMAGWPAAHYGYRQRDVGEIVGLLDEAIANLRAAAGVGAFDVALVANVREGGPREATARAAGIEPLLAMPTPRESLTGILGAVRVANRSAERISLLQTALMLLDEAGAVIPRGEAAGFRTSIRARIHDEQVTDQRYQRVSTRLLNVAQRAAAGARVADVEAALARVPIEDTRLGRVRPEVVQALQASLRWHLESAQQLRLRRDQWVVRRALYREYERSVGAQVWQLIRSQPEIDSIKRLDGPAPKVLARLDNRLSGGAEQLQRIPPPPDLRGVHDLLVGSWRFAEQAIRARRTAVSSANVDTARQASSAAAAALMLLDNAQRELRSFVEPPQVR